MNRVFFVFALLLSCIALPVNATNTSGVHGPVVDPTDSSFQYRFAFQPGDDGAPDATAHRLHYQRALNDQFRARVLTQFRDRGGDSDFEYDYLRAELLWYFRPKQNDNWDSGLRFDIRTRKGSRPELFSINWTNQWTLSPKWRLRGIVIGGWNFGGNAEGGTNLSTRASLNYKLESGHRVGVEMFNEYGLVSDMGSFSEQEHQLGPVLSGKMAGVSYQVGYLAGISSAASDHNFRLWFGKSF
ncbi:hypothetical protein [Alteromonas oceanisediminis]|uniref:hypothetical protein n=1 Tax=Alteromonas oceanisediminis TaxID=2836180 RepID=UPI001BD9D996|nr:hypothetical protein [Alteromonas oceanisediminis]MBT0588163.1 hypothetical protein [Alteromonas oceanisediminis]